ncbi:hypothetical protein [Idiomarina abyssalis]|uniref:hypothetical protein n=1 Tax=Idiomarina abyssalis TaxID=86102 RepID=UPI003A8CAF64
MSETKQKMLKEYFPKVREAQKTEFLKFLMEKLFKGGLASSHHGLGFDGIIDSEEFKSLLNREGGAERIFKDFKEKTKKSKPDKSSKTSELQGKTIRLLSSDWRYLDSLKNSVSRQSSVTSKKLSYGDLVSYLISKSKEFDSELRQRKKQLKENYDEEVQREVRNKLGFSSRPKNMLTQDQLEDLMSVIDRLCLKSLDKPLETLMAEIRQGKPKETEGD